MMDGDDATVDRRRCRAKRNRSFPLSSAHWRAIAGALIFSGTLLVSATVAAQTGTYNPDTPADTATEARLKALSQELRCLVCQNQTIADSSADLAVDLRRLVRDQIVQGKTDSEIKTYLVSRYGDFVLYKPPVQANTMPLWAGPFALLSIGSLTWWFISRRRASTLPAAISDTDEAAAKKLLDE